MLIEQLLNAMPEDLRVWLSEKKPATGSEAGRLADEYVLAHKRNRLEVPRSSSNEDTTSGREPRKCHNCGLEGHLAWNCTMTKNRDWRGTRVKGLRESATTVTRGGTWQDSAQQCCIVDVWGDLGVSSRIDRAQCRRMGKGCGG